MLDLRFTNFTLSLSRRSKEGASPNAKPETFNIIMKHTQTATVREMRTLANTCQNHAERAWQAKDTAEQAASSARLADRSATVASGHADAAWLEAKAAAKRAAHAAAHAEKLLRINIITLMTITAISVVAFLLILL